MLIFVVFLFAALWFTNQFDQKDKELTWKEFEKLIVSDNVEAVTVSQNKNVPTGRVEIQVDTKNDEDSVRYLYVSDVNEIQNYLKEKKIDYEMPDVPQDSWFATTIVPMLLVLGGVLLIFLLMNRQGGGANAKAMNFGKSRARLSTDVERKITFGQVAGLKEEKEELEEIVDFLKAPKKYIQVGARIPKGVLLVGPPGTGKTLLAKAVAGEAGVPFFTISGSDFVEMFVGVGASRVRDLFKQAQQMAPCIIFIDEIDAIGKSRDNGMHGGGNDEREQTLNALLAEMDGFDTSKGIIILAATNRPEVLDKALLRPGRFDRRVIVERPDLKGRIETLKVHAKDVKMDETVDFEEIALATSGAVGSDLANMINEAALGAVKAGRKAVSQKDLFEAVEVVIAGKEKKDRILGDEEKHIVAYHEVGHALVMALQKESEPVQKITIVPRTMGALGYTMQRPEEEKYLNKKDEMLADLVSFFGGRAAEEVKFNSVTTGASNDIERATAIARAMVTQYGMSDEFGLIGLESITNRYLDGRAVMNCAETTAAKVDEVVMKMLKEAYAKAVTYIRENMDILDEAAEFLIQRETITGKEFMEIFNKYKNPVEESDKNVSETAENDAEISEAEVKTDSEIKTEEENTSTYNTGYAQWVEDDDDEE